MADPDLRTDVYDLRTEANRGFYTSMHSRICKKGGLSAFTLSGVSTAGILHAYAGTTDPAVAICYISTKRRSLSELSSAKLPWLLDHLVGLVPFSKVIDNDTGNTLILPMGLTKLPRATGRGGWSEEPLESHLGVRPISGVAPMLFTAILKINPRAVIFTRFAGNHTKLDDAVKYWSGMFPGRLFIGWARFHSNVTTMGKGNLQYQALEARMDALQDERALLEESSRRYRQLTETILDINDELDELIDAEEGNPGSKLVTTTAIPGLNEPTGAMPGFGAPRDSGPFLEHNTFVVKCKGTPLVTVYNANQIPELQKIADSHHFTGLGTLFTAWSGDIVPHSAVENALVDLCV